MAANFWQSSHCDHWLLDKSRIFRSNPGDLDLFSTRNDIQLLRRYFMDFISAFGVLLGLRQRVIATAQVFFKRFYLSYSFSQFDPRLTAPTMLFVAGKVEECPINAKFILQKLNKLGTLEQQLIFSASINTPAVNTTGGVSSASASSGGPSGNLLPMPPMVLVNASFPPSSTPATNTAAAASSSSASPTTVVASSTRDTPYFYELDDLLEMEFAILVGLKYDLIVYHPYRPLMQFLTDLNLQDCLQVTWEIVNDSYRLDLPLLYPPYLIAITAIYITCNFLNKDSTSWFKSLNVEQEKIIEIARDLLALWEDSEVYASKQNEKKLLSLLKTLNEKKFQTLAQIKQQQQQQQSNEHSTVAASSNAPTAVNINTTSTMTASLQHQSARPLNAPIALPPAHTSAATAASVQAVNKRTIDQTTTGAAVATIPLSMQDDGKRAKYGL